MKSIKGTRRLLKREGPRLTVPVVTRGRPKPKKYRFRLSMHIIDRKNPFKSDWWIRWRGNDIFVKTVMVDPPMVTKIRKSQPIGVMVGKSSEIWVSKNNTLAVIY